jgi:ABC-type multidrug transport system fused ATPase/permease subunit
VTEPPRPSGLRRIEREFLRHRRLTLGLALAGLLAQSLLALPVPLLQGWVVDRLVPLFRAGAGAVAAADRAALGRAVALAVAGMVACHAGRMALGWKVSALMSRVTLEVVRELTDALHRKLQRLEMSYFDRQQTGQIMARLTADVGSLLLFLNGGALQVVSDLVLAAGIAGLMLWLRWELGLAALLAVPLFALNHRCYSDRIHGFARGARAQVEALYALLSERVSAVRVVRSFGKEDEEVKEFDRRLDAQRDVGWAGMQVAARQGAAATLINGLGTVAVVAVGALLVHRGRMTVGDLLAFYAFVTQLYQPIVRLTGFQAMMAATAVAVDRIVEVLEEPEPPHAGAGGGGAARPRGGLAFRGVSFTYPTGARPVLDGVDLDVAPGTTLGVLGASGSGKSTLLALAPRIYDLADGEGAVLLDGRDVRGLSRAALRRAVALVPQQAMLFEGTIRSNLTYAIPDASPEAVRRALESADLAELVDTLPLGLDTPVGERGQTLSGGQRQRVALARALVADPAVLLLDDCTSALDAETEARIQAALRTHQPGQTVVVVSHKVSSVRDADRIAVLDGGKVAELGTHDDLIRRGGLYARAYRQQTEALVYASPREPGGPDADRPPRRRRARRPGRVRDWADAPQAGTRKG